MLYFAYGSNLNPKRMAERAPSAQAAGIGILHGWRLVERLYADIEPATGECVFGILYRMTDQDLERLDRCEGVPKIYERMRVSVESARVEVSAYAYLMTVAARGERNGAPYPKDYRLICSAGADFHHIPNAFRRRLKPAFGNLYVAVYGTLMTGERNYRWGAGAVRRTPCRIYGTIFDTGYGYPAFVPKIGGTVSAELLEVTPEVLAQMDVLEGYPNLYRQELVLAETPAGMTDALVYVMNDLPKNAVPIPSGNWRQYRKESLQY